MDDTWKWRNLRELGFEIGFWPFCWSLGAETSADRFGGVTMINVGPLALNIHFNAGRTPHD